MSEPVGYLLMGLVGVMLTPQGALNRGLAGWTGGIASAFLNFAVGLAVVVAATAVAGELGGLGAVFDVPPGDAAGGLLGAAYVTVVILSIGELGAGGIAALTVTGQLTSSLVLDSTGALGLPGRDLTAPLALGAVVVLAGTCLVVFGGGRGGGRLLRSSPRAIAMALAAGLALGVQHPLNAHLASRIGDLESSVTNFVVGTAALLAILVASGQLRRLPRVLAVVRGRAGDPYPGGGGDSSGPGDRSTGEGPGAPVAPGREPTPRPPRPGPVYLVGGVIGGANATVGLVVVAAIGAGGLTVASITGQMLSSLAFDRIGALGLPRRALTPARLAGAALLVAGTVLVAL